MAFSSTISTQTAPSTLFTIIQTSHSQPQFNFTSFPLPDIGPSPSSRSVSCSAAAKPQSGPVKKRPTSNSKKKKKPDKRTSPNTDVEIVEDVEMSSQSQLNGYQPLPLPKPPAGFVLDEQGRVLMASNKRIATIVSFQLLFFPLVKEYVLCINKKIHLIKLLLCLILLRR